MIAGRPISFRLISRNMNISHHPLFFILLIFISGFILIVESNQSCGNTRVLYPFGFSRDSIIRLNCTNGSELKINDFTVQNFTSDHIRLNFPAECNRSIDSIHQLFSKNYALSWRNSLLLQDCNSPLNDCVIPASMLENRFLLQSCDNSLTDATLNCYSQTYGGGVEFMDYSTLIANCRVLHSSIALDLVGNMSSSGGGSTNVSLDFQMVELGWWVDGGWCQCVNCTVFKSPGGTAGSRCLCLGGFEGDGFADGDIFSRRVDQKWLRAPLVAMLRRHQSDYDANNSMLHVVFILLPPSSNIKKVKYSSIVLQPLDLNLDEETSMKIVPFRRKSLSDPKTPSQQYYFDHFEIHPLKIIASFLPGDSYSSYSSTQETLRSLLHSVLKVPAVKSKTVELNGILVTHALITIRELSIKCAQHYSWYVLRAIYIANGGPLLPPAFASIFYDLALSSLDIFFEPSSGLLNRPGLTLGTFKLLSKCIDGKGFSGDLGKTLRAAGSNILFAAVTEVSDSVLKGAESSGVNGMVNGFHQGLLKLAMEPSVLRSAFMEGGPNRKIKLDRNPGVDEVVLKNLPPNSTLMDEIVDRVNSFLVAKGLLKGGTSSLRGESEWRISPTIRTLCEDLFVSFAISGLRNQADKVISRFNLKGKLEANDQKAVPAAGTEQGKVKLVWKWGIGKFELSDIVTNLDGQLCRSIPYPIARRIVSGFLVSFLDQNDDK